MFILQYFSREYTFSWIVEHLEIIAMLSLEYHERICYCKLFQLARDDNKIYQSVMFRNECSLEIKKISSAQSKLIVSETKKSIINKVKSIITNNYLDIYFILGGTGSGKSTALCFLRGRQTRTGIF